MPAPLRLGGTAKPVTVNLSGLSRAPPVTIKPTPIPSARPLAPSRPVPTRATPAAAKAAATTKSSLSPVPTLGQLMTGAVNGYQNTAALQNAQTQSTAAQINNWLALANAHAAVEPTLHIQSLADLWGKTKEIVTIGAPKEPGALKPPGKETIKETRAPLLEVPGQAPGTTPMVTPGKAIPKPKAITGEGDGGKAVKPPIKETVKETKVPMLPLPGQVPGTTPWVYAGAEIPVTGAPSLSSQLRDALAGAAAIPQAVTQQAKNLISGFSGWADMSIMDINDWGTATVNASVPTAQQALQAITGTADQAYGDWLSGCTGPLCDITGGLTSGIEGAVSGAMSAIAGIMQAISGYLQNLGSNVMNLANSAKTAVDSILSAAKEIPGQIATAVKGIYERMESTITKIPDWIKGAYEWAVSKLEGLVTTIKEGFQGLYEWAFGKVSEIVTPLVERVRQAVQPAIDAANATWDKLSGLWGTITSAYDALKSTVEGVIEQGRQLWEYLTHINWTQAISEAISSLISWLTAVVEPALKKLLPSDEDVKKALKGAMSSLGGTAQELLGEMCSDPLAQGR